MNAFRRFVVRVGATTQTNFVCVFSLLTPVAADAADHADGRRTAVEAVLRDAAPAGRAPPRARRAAPLEPPADDDERCTERRRELHQSLADLLAPVAVPRLRRLEQVRLEADAGLLQERGDEAAPDHGAGGVELGLGGKELAVPLGGAAKGVCRRRGRRRRGRQRRRLGEAAAVLTAADLGNNVSQVEDVGLRPGDVFQRPAQGPRAAVGVRDGEEDGAL